MLFFFSFFLFFFLCGPPFVVPRLWSPVCGPPFVSPVCVPRLCAGNWVIGDCPPFFLCRFLSDALSRYSGEAWGWIFRACKVPCFLNRRRQSTRASFAS